MSEITAIGNPLNGDENPVFILNRTGGLGMLSPALFGRQNNGQITGEAGSAVVPSHLTSVLYCKTVCVFGIVRATDTVTLAANPHQSKVIAMLSPVPTRFSACITKSRCISSVASGDGKRCWIYYIGMNDKIWQLSLPGISLSQVETSGNISSATSLAAFMYSPTVPSVIYQGSDKIIHAARSGNDRNILKNSDPHPASLGTRMSLTTNNDDTVHLYYVGLNYYLKRLELKAGGEATASIVSSETLNGFDDVQFAAIGGRGENTIYILREGNLEQKRDQCVAVRRGSEQKDRQNWSGSIEPRSVSGHSGKGARGVVPKAKFKRQGMKTTQLGDFLTASGYKSHHEQSCDEELGGRDLSDGYLGGEGLSDGELSGEGLSNKELRVVADYQGKV